MVTRLRLPLRLTVMVVACVVVVCGLGVLGAGRAGAASSSTASFTYPLAGAQNVDTSKPFAWTSVPNVQTYYLYVGTAQGLKDVVDTGGIASTSYSVPPLPTGQTLWARIWTKLNDAWTYQDVSFTAAPITTARLVFPVNGAQGIDPTVPFSWYAVPNVQTYVLYVGTTRGAQDLLYSGGTLQTSWQVTNLPVGPTLWARIWTKLNDAWTYQDVSFTAAAAGRSVFKYPMNNSTSVDTSHDFAWTAVNAAQTYTLYVGTSQGASDLVNTYATSATSYPVPPLPTGRTLWARIYAQVNNAWVYSDVSFQVSVSASRLTYPLPGQTGVDSRNPFTWAAAPGAEGYFLWVGSTPGSSDLASSGSTTATSFAVPPLPVGQTLYARLYTKINGNWNTHTDLSFTVAYSAAKLTYPAKPNALGLDVSKPFTWTSIPGATGYVLWIGTSPGATDVVYSGMLTSASYNTGPLPVGAQLYARIWTQASGAWLSGADVPFSPNAMITAPAQGAVKVDRTQPITWARGATLNGTAPGYRLLIGTKPGASDLYDSGIVAVTSMVVPANALPAGQVLYARVKVKLGDGTQRRSDVAFTTADTPFMAPQLVFGSAGPAAVDASQPFTWTATDVAAAYRLQIQNSSGAAVVDSGTIQVPRYFAETLPIGAYTAVLSTQVAGAWTSSTTPINVTANGANPTTEIDSAHWAIDYVRHMADPDGYPFMWTELESAVNATFSPTQTQAFCSDYSNELLRILKQMNVTATQPAGNQPRRFDTFFNYFNGHTMVEFWNEPDSDWIVLDPTFDIAMVHASDGKWATQADAHAATVARNWSAVRYIYLGDYGATLANGYYLDYPLLYLNTGATTPKLDPIPYMTSYSLPVNQSGTYSITADQPSVTINVDGQPRTVTFGGTDPLSRMFQGTTISLPSGSTANVTAYAPNRYVF